MFGDDCVANVNHISTIGLFFGVGADKDACHFALQRAIGMDLCSSKCSLTNEDINGGPGRMAERATFSEDPEEFSFFFNLRRFFENFFFSFTFLKNRFGFGD